MNTFIAYDTDTFQVLGFIRNDYTKFEETNEIFQWFENYKVIKTELEIPSLFSLYKIKIENEQVIGFEKMEVSKENN